MTVRELIAALQKLPDQDAEVLNSELLIRGEQAKADRLQREACHGFNTGRDVNGYPYPHFPG